MRSIKCNLCRNDDFTDFHPLGNSTIVRCNKCGLFYLNPQLEEEDLKKLYDMTYFASEDSAVSGYDNYDADEENIIRTSHKKLKRIEHYYPNKGKLIDVGCATGIFPHVASLRGWEAFGVEYSDFAAEQARKKYNLQVTTGTIHDIDFPDGYFDCITMWDLIEHVKDPRSDLEKAYSLLKVGGILAVMTPNAESLISKIWGKKWLLWNRTDHLFFFGPSTFNRLLREVGFEIIKTRKIGFGGKFVSVNFVFDRLINYNKLLFGICQLIFKSLKLSNIVFYADWGDNFVVFARKQNANG